jgi:membrane-associated protein
VIHTSFIPWLDPTTIIQAAGGWALLVVCGIIFAETGLLVGFVLPGDTLLVITGILTFKAQTDHSGGFQVHIIWVCLLIGLAAFLGGELGYLIGRRAGHSVFERKESGLFSVKNVKRTSDFFERFGALAVVVARFVPVVRTFAPVAAGVGRMNYPKYSLYNLVGALLWGTGITLFGFFLGYIPPVANFLENYIDMVLLAAVVITVVPTALHYIHAAHQARTTRRMDAAGTVDLPEGDAADE